VSGYLTPFTLSFNADSLLDLNGFRVAFEFYQKFK
jgi:hypothetical protein